MLSIVIAGFNRCLSVTTPSLNEFVIGPAKAYNSENEILGVISRTTQAISSSWSGEVGLPEYDVPLSLKADTKVLLNQSELDAENGDLLKWAIRRRRLQTAVERDVATNMLRALRVLEHAENEIAESSDYILHIRPDLLVHGPFDFSKLIAQTRKLSPSGSSAILTPNWGWQPNDKYAFLTGDLRETYFGRIRKFAEFVDTDLEFSAESFLKYSLRESSQAPKIAVRASRVRLNGEIKKENFRLMKFPKQKKRSRVEKLLRRIRRVTQFEGAKD